MRKTGTYTGPAQTGTYTGPAQTGTYTGPAQNPVVNSTHHKSETYEHREGVNLIRSDIQSKYTALTAATSFTYEEGVVCVHAAAD